MGSADYMPNMCVIICPLDGQKCNHGVFRMNGSCKPSQVRVCPRPRSDGQWALC